MRLPRNVSGDELINALGRLGYVPTRQSGSHVRLTRGDEETAQSHVTVPRHGFVKVGTLNAILREVAGQLDLTRDELIDRIWG